MLIVNGAFVKHYAMEIRTWQMPSEMGWAVRWNAKHSISISTRSLRGAGRVDIAGVVEVVVVLGLGFQVQSKGMSYRNPIEIPWQKAREREREPSHLQYWKVLAKRWLFNRYMEKNHSSVKYMHVIWCGN